MNNVNQNKIPTIKLKSIVLDCPDIQALSDFYIRMLGWEKDFVEEGDFLDICSPLGGVRSPFKPTLTTFPLCGRKNLMRSSRCYTSTLRYKVRKI
ncbi:hypothetical protein SDC9_11380 [bioreactor metagenome]|uniref:Glyoxalase-like domain-containing protein n=1 Tax=bioreactor metagenome TaxID=1076179 RepID=A0A644TFH2_9ZZZZ